MCSRRIYRLRYLLLVLMFALTAPSYAAKDKYRQIDWELPAPRFAEFGVSAEKVAQIAGGGQFVIVAKPADFEFWNARSSQLKSFQDKRVIYVATVIDAPADEVREMVWNFDNHEDISPLLKKTKVIQKYNDNSVVVSYEQIIKVPIIKLASDFVMQMDKKENGDIGMVLVDKGDVESSYQYFEFFPVGKNRTLAVLSGWQDTDSASFTYKLILEAEPAIGKVFPTLWLYERIVQFQNEAAKRYPEIAQKPDDKVYDIRSVNAYISERQGVDMLELKKLTQLGSIQFYQKSRRVDYQGTEADIIQVTAIQHIPLPKETIRPVLNSFHSLAAYNELTSEWIDPENTGADESWGDLRIGVNIGPIFIPVEIYPTLEEISDTRMIYYTADHSYMYPLFGHIEHVDLAELGDEGTIVTVTIGGAMGDEASFVFKMARYLPFHDVLICATYTMLTSDSMKGWVINHIAEKEKQKAQKVGAL